jgi:uncharacterized OB-fold protein
VTTAQALPADRVHITTDPHTQPFWDAAREHRLVACQCAKCGQFRMPPSPFCPHCQSEDKQWPELSGRGTVFSFSVVHGVPGLADLTLVAIIVDLDGAPGVHLVSNLVDVDPVDVSIGLDVQVDFTPVADGYELPIFRPSATP